MKGPESRAGMKPRTRAVLMTPVALLTYYGVPSSLAFGGDIAHAPDLGTLARSGITHTPDLDTLPSSSLSKLQKCTGGILFLQDGRKVPIVSWNAEDGDKRYSRHNYQTGTDKTRVLLTISGPSGQDAYAADESGRKISVPDPDEAGAMKTLEAAVGGKIINIQPVKCGPTGEPVELKYFTDPAHRKRALDTTLTQK